MTLLDTEVAASLARLATQIEHLRETQDRNAADIKQLVHTTQELAQAQRGQRTFVMGVTATVSVLWGVGLALVGLLRAHFS